MEFIGKCDLNDIIIKLEESVYYRCFALLCLGAYSLMNIPFPEFYESYIQFFSYVVVLVFFLARSSEKKIFPYWLFFVVLIYVAISWWLGHFQEPIYYSGNVDLHKLGRHFLFVVIAYYLCNNKGGSAAAFIMLFLMYVGAFFIPWSTGAGWEAIERGLAGLRVDFHMQNAQHMGLLYGVLFISFAVFSKRIYLFDKRIFFVALLMSIFYFSYVLFSQTRAVFIALIFSLSVGVFMLLRSSGGSSRSFIFYSIILVLIVTSLIVYMPDRLINEWYKMYHSYSNGDVFLSSMGARWYSWMAAWDWIASRPLLGWGSEASRTVVQNSEMLKDSWASNFYFMHNSLVEIVVCYGVAGFSLYVSLVFWFCYQLRRLHRDKVLPTDVFIFAWCFFTYWLVVNMFESHMFFRVGVGIFNVVCAFLCFFIYQEKMTKLRIEGEKH